MSPAPNGTSPPCETTNEGPTMDVPVGNLLSRAEIATFELTPDGTVSDVNEAFTALTGFAREALLDRPFSHLAASGHLPPSVETLLRENDGADPRESVNTTASLETESGTAVLCEVHLQRVERPDGGERYLGVVRPKGRREREGSDGRERPEDAPAKAFVALADAVRDGIIVLDADSRIQYANPAVERILGHSPEELVGGSKIQIIPERLRDVHLDALQTYLDTGERNIDWGYVELPGQHKDGYEVPLGISLNDFFFEGDRYFVGLFRDISKRKKAERELAAKAAQQETVAELGHEALTATDVDSLLDEVVGRVADTLDAEYCEVLELDAADGQFRFRAGVGWDDDVVGSATIPVSETTQAGYTLSTERPVVVEDFETDSRFDGADGIADFGVRSGIDAIIGPVDDPWGILGVHDAAARDFSAYDVHFVENIAHIVATAIDRHAYTRTLEVQREELEALNRLNRLAQEIQRAIITESSREEIEQLVCDRLARKDNYAFTWIGQVDLADQTLTPVARAGDDKGYVDDVTVTLDERKTGKGPAGMAVQTRDVQIVSDVETDEAFGPWREAALERGVRSVATIPIVYEQTVYGVLGIYAEERDAFGPDVQSIFGSFGEMVGHAIAAATQKHALLTREMTEVTLQFRNLADLLDGQESDIPRLEVSQVVPTGQESYVLVGTAPPESEATILGLAAGVPSISDANVTEVSDDESEFRVRIRSPPLISQVVARGGRVSRIVVNDAGLTATMELPPHVETAEIVEEVKASYPSADVLLQRRKTVERPVVSEKGLLESLTERQRTALELAYRRGYFEWPRKNSGEDLAEILGVSPATFHQHLRTSERKLLTEILDGAGLSADASPERRSGNRS
ncbi:PAS domain S-box protein [Halopelagius longus]|uniref:PAS domain S-box protein n=1 Tax=Halopelagius longus TaxID=1236180 RepID=A0A1H1EJF4_9EURY|nr:PAS domain S-box protein [Halopelagius longus]RDI71781.1 PAS domain S-box protein [Halopelagius longus]SDQ88862.1 PAS domain S-box-containing protein [Halopelagius longus]